MDEELTLEQRLAQAEEKNKELEETMKAQKEDADRKTGKLLNELSTTNAILKDALSGRKDGNKRSHDVGVDDPFDFFSLEGGDEDETDDVGKAPPEKTALEQRLERLEQTMAQQSRSQGEASFYKEHPELDTPAMRRLVGQIAIDVSRTAAEQGLSPAEQLEEVVKRAKDPKLLRKLVEELSSVGGFKVIEEERTASDTTPGGVGTGGPRAKPDKEAEEQKQFAEKQKKRFGLTK